MSFTPEQIMAVKGQGFLPQKDKIHFAARIIIPAGHMTTTYSAKINELAEKYGRGYFTLTQRLDVEIPWIQYEAIESPKKELSEVGLEVGGTFGRNKVIGKELAGVYSIPDALDIIERGIKFYLANGEAGERFAAMVERLGFEVVEKAMLDVRFPL